MIANGFENKRRNDYENAALGLIIEDLHDELVLTRNNLPYFIKFIYLLVLKRRIILNSCVSSKQLECMNKFSNVK